VSVLLVIAKAPVPGLAKTRLCPPATAVQAARIAAAALLDTVDNVLAGTGVPAVALTGDLSRAQRGSQIRAVLGGWTVWPQRGDTFADRLADAHANVATHFPGEPVVQIGMDTPQASGALLAEASQALRHTDAAVGAASDGGWWALALRDPRQAEALRRVPMSRPDTGARTVAALRARGLSVAALPELSDVDTMADAVRVADALPGSRFAAAVAEVTEAAEVAGAAGGRGAGAAGFAPALAGRACWREDSDGRRQRIPVRRWHGEPEPALHPLLARCTGPTLDIGCGPGRLAGELAERAVPVLGVDHCPLAAALTRARGAATLCGSVFDPLPEEGRWQHLLLADGNIGIGGDPVALLRRCADLLRRGGTVLAELDPPGAGVWRGESIVDGTPFRWARVPAQAADSLAGAAGLRTVASLVSGGRCFAVLEKP
jgi:uncharacterized protein